MNQIDSTHKRLSEDELRILLHSFIRENTRDQMINQDYSGEDLQRFIMLRDKVALILESIHSNNNNNTVNRESN